MHTIEADYLVVGAGAMGMAFIDTLVTETEARVVLVDRNHQPGGHWTTAYPFVRLHQPSAFYGVNSMPLGSDAIDQVGWNEGLYELATSGEVCSYYDHVMRQRFLPTGRVSYFPMSEHRGDGRFTTLAGPIHRERDAPRRRRHLHAGHGSLDAPAALPGCASGRMRATNGLPKVAALQRYIIVGAGKTGTDACLWLLGQGHRAGPADLDHAPRLVVAGPRDNPARSLFADRIKATFTAQLRPIRDAASLDDLFLRLEEAGALLRIDPAMPPTMYRCATVTRAELSSCDSPDVVRMGHLVAGRRDKMVLDGGAVPLDRSALYVDCTADGAEKCPQHRFDPGRITLQSVARMPADIQRGADRPRQSRYPDDTVAKRACRPLEHPDTDLDWSRITVADTATSGAGSTTRT